MKTHRLFTTAFAISASIFASKVWAGFLQISTLQDGSAGSFQGTLDGISVTGFISAPDPNSAFRFKPVGTDFELSTIDNTSPQYSYSDIYTPSIETTDRVGYESDGGGVNPATITITFSNPVTNPIFQVANLDNMQFDFSHTPGASLIVLSGNGDGADGLEVTGSVIADANPSTVDFTNPTSHPPTSGGRSAYGSVEIVGEYTQLTINVSQPDMVGDGGSFTLSTIPEPSVTALLDILMAIFLAKRTARLQGAQSFR